MMIRTIRVNFGQSGDLSVLIPRLADQQRWAYNMAVQETLRNPDVTFYDLCGMLTKWRNEHKWLDGPVLVQRAASTMEGLPH